MLGGLRAIGGGTVSGREGKEEDLYFHVVPDRWQAYHQGGGTLTGMRGHPLFGEEWGLTDQEAYRAPQAQYGVAEDLLGWLSGNWKLVAAAGAIVTALFLLWKVK